MPHRARLKQNRPTPPPTTAPSARTAPWLLGLVLGLMGLIPVAPNLVWAQTALRPTPETTTALPPLNLHQYADADTVTVEFQHAGLTYASEDVLTLFGPQGRPLDPGTQQVHLDCTTLAQCQTAAASEPSANLPVPARGRTGRTTYRWPVRFRMNAPLQPKTYLLEVRDAGGAIKHYRRLQLVPPAPFVDDVSVRQNSAPPTDGSTLLVDPTQDLDAEIVIEGGPFYDDTQVTLQDHPLVERRRTRNRLVLDLTLDAETVNQLELGVWPLQFSHPIATEVASVDWDAVLATVTLRGTEPPLLQQPQPIYVVGAQSGSITQSLQVNGFYFSPQAELCTEGGPLVDATCTGITQQDGQTLSAPVVLDLPTGFDGGTFQVYVRNGDGQESARKPVRVEPQKVAASVSEVSPDEPIVEGVATEVIFQREAANSFPSSGPFVLEVNGQTQRLTPIQPPTADALRTTVTVPDGTGGQNPVFVLSANGQNWAGEFPTVAQRPRLVSDATALRRGSETRLTFDPPTESSHLVARTPGLEIESGQLYDGEARLRATEDLTSNHVDVWVRVKSRVVDSLRIPVEPWPAPEQVLAVGYGGQRAPLDSVQTIELVEGNGLRLHPAAAFVGQERPPRVTVQLRDDNGALLRDPVPVRFDRAAPVELYPSAWGLSGGDEFTIAFTTPDGRSSLRRAYIQRPLIKQFVVSGGLTAVEYTFGGDRDVQRGNTLSGVNLGLHWVPEWFAPTAMRPIGFGLHTVASEVNDQVRLRVATSVLVFEKLAIGLSFGSGGSALFVGANASFLDLSKLFSPRSRR